MFGRCPTVRSQVSPMLQSRLSAGEGSGYATPVTRPENGKWRARRVRFGRRPRTRRRTAMPYLLALATHSAAQLLPESVKQSDPSLRKSGQNKSGPDHRCCISGLTERDEGGGGGEVTGYPPSGGGPQPTTLTRPPPPVSPIPSLPPSSPHPSTIFTHTRCPLDTLLLFPPPLPTPSLSPHIPHKPPQPLIHLHYCTFSTHPPSTTTDSLFLLSPSPLSISPPFFTVTDYPPECRSCDPDTHTRDLQ